MKITGKRTLALLLAALMLTSVSCSTAGGNEETSPSPSESTSAEVTPNEAPAETEPTLNLEKRDFDGETFSIMGGEWYGYAPLDYVDIVVEEILGEGLNDAAYNRNLTMNALYNCNVEFSQLSIDSNLSALKEQIISDDKSYDVVLLRGYHASAAVTGGYLADMGTMPNLDFNRPWWYGEAIENFEVGGKNLVGLGYITTNHMNAVWTSCFNTQMITDYNLENPYTLVKEGRWTFDKAVEMAMVVSDDTDGDGVHDEDDIWGIHHTDDTVTGILNSCGVKVAVMNEGKMEKVIDQPQNVERMLDILTKLFNEDYAVDVNTRDHMKSRMGEGGFFLENKALFLFTATHLVWQLREMDMNFGMLPYPKYSETDEYISTTAGNFNTLVTVPANVENPDAVGYFMEAYSYEGWKNLKPVYYDAILQGKLVRDEESGDMLDYIYNNLTFDVGVIYNIESICGAIADLSSKMDTNVASFLQRHEKRMNKCIDDFNAAVAGDGTVK